MFEFLFGRAKKNLKPTVVVETVGSKPKKSDIRLEMIRLALKSVLRSCGIPLQWIGCEISPKANKGDSEAILIQLVILKWHDELMRFAPELQKRFLTEIQFFDSNADAANLLVLWKFAPDCGCPNDKLPEAGFWASLVKEPTPPEQTVSVKSLAAAAPLAAALPAAKFDLPKSKLDDDKGDDGFAATQIFEQK